MGYHPSLLAPFLLKGRAKKGILHMTNAHNQQQEKLIQFQHPEKILPFLPGLTDTHIATLFDLDTADYQALKSRFQEQVREAAQELLADAAFADGIDRLPFQPGETVLGLGESSTDDLLSWLELLRQAFELRRPHDQVRFVNAGVSGQTTTQALRSLTATLLQQPNWLICFLGANDVQRIGFPLEKSLVSLEETARNVAAIQHLAATQTKAHQIWITPPLIVPERVAANPFFQRLQLAWNNDDLIALGDLLRRQLDSVLDLQAIFGNPTPLDLMYSDGIHPSLAGQQAIVRALVKHLI
jgi:lysophospholipase L1-like esterase